MRAAIFIALVIGMRLPATAQGITAPVFERAGVIDAGIYDVTVDADGNVYFLGFHDPDQGTFDLDPGAGVTIIEPGDYESFILFVGKCTPQLDLEWLKVARWMPSEGANGGSQDLHIAVDSDGNVLVGGTISPLPAEAIEFGEPGNLHTITFDTNGDHELVWKFGPNGETEWVKTFGDECRLRDLASDSDGNVYIRAGTGAIGGDFDPGSGVHWIRRPNGSPIVHHPVVVKLAPDGDFEWAVDFGGSDGDAGYSDNFGVGEQGDVYIAIPFSGQIDANLQSGVHQFLADPNNVDTYEMLIVRFDADGQLIWGRLAHSTDASPRKLLIDDSGGLLMHSSDEMLERYAPNGTRLWSRSVYQDHVNASLSVHDLVLGQDNDFYITGDYFFDSFYIHAAAPNRSTLQPPGRFIARCTLDFVPLWTTRIPFIDDPLLLDHDVVSERIFYTPDNGLLVTASAYWSIDADPSVQGTHPVVQFNDGDHRFVKYRSAGEAWVQLDRTVTRQRDGTPDFPQSTLANAMRAIQPGEPIKILSPGDGTSSPEIGTFSKPTTISVVGGPARIGVQP